ncbi:TIGR02147 family protein [Bdellovibrio sp. HCB2-146]|uniref:TIGR02147 family protein n=1 Tax=Bdellovibrio sp. HCB2-146 TaxID=3394362 RepID=UPI0039BD01B0
MSRAAEYLIAQYNSKKLKNPRFSIRAFAQQLGINSGRLSEYMNGERTISKTMAQKMSPGLRLDAAEAEYFLHLVAADERARKSTDYRVLADDELALLVEWHHYVILSLISTRDFILEPSWIAERLEIPEPIVVSSLALLSRLGLITIDNGKVERKTGPISTTTDIPSQFVRLAHKEKLQYILNNMDRVPVEKRDLSTITLAIDESKIPEAKIMIQNFRRKLATHLSKGKRNQVYTMSFELFPFSKTVPMKKGPRL